MAYPSFLLALLVMVAMLGTLGLLALLAVLWAQLSIAVAAVERYWRGA